MIEKPLPSGQPLVFQQYIEDGEYHIHCTACDEERIPVADMGGHAIRVHLRATYFVEMRVEREVEFDFNKAVFRGEPCNSIFK